MNKKKYLKAIATIPVIFTITLTGCSATKTVKNPNDPYEGFNRSIFAFNRGVDKVILKPVAKGYNFVVPQPAQHSVSNFFDNIGEVPTMANDILQVNPKHFATDTARLAVNTTVGIGGLFDPASKMGLEKNKQDFGLTLAKWGSAQSPYLVLPIIGSTTLRDSTSVIVDSAFDPTNYIHPDKYQYMLQGTNLVNGRSQALPKDKAIDSSPDPYAYVRDDYLKERTAAIDKNSGNIVPNQNKPATTISNNDTGCK